MFDHQRLWVVILNIETSIFVDKNMPISDIQIFTGLRAVMIVIKETDSVTYKNKQKKIKKLSSFRIIL